MICKICELECKSGQALSKHIHIKHDISTKDYYDKYYKKENEGICPTCNKPTPFYGIIKGYQHYCCAKCAQNGNNNWFKTNNPKHKNITYKKPKRKKVNFNCNMCNMYFDNLLAIRNHIVNGHKMSLEKYWLQYQSGTCCICNKPVKVTTLGFKPYCSRVCRNLYLYNTTTNIKKIKDKQNRITKLRTDFEQQNDVISFCDAIKKYGQGWLSIKNTVPTVVYEGKTYITDTTNIIKYCEIDHYRNNSIEQKIIDTISKVYNKDIITHSRKIISPFEIDIYLPDIKLAIEYNGLYWHSDINGENINYHLNKSIACKEKDIRLIHIYEFEDFNIQMYILTNLLLGQDNYPKDDFNKNNLSNFIPEPTIIYQDKRYTIYGAGPLL